MKQRKVFVVEPLKLVSVTRIGSRLWLAVRDRSQRKHFIAFRFRTASDARTHVRSMRQWIDREAPLAYVRRRGEGALIDIDALLARAIA